MSHFFGIGQNVLIGATKSPVSGEAHIGIAVAKEVETFSKAFFTEVGKEPDAAGRHSLIGVREEL